MQCIGETADVSQLLENRDDPGGGDSSFRATPEWTEDICGRFENDVGGS